MCYGRTRLPVTVDVSMTVDYHANVCKMQQERVEQAMLFYAIFHVYLSSSDADGLYTISDSVDWDPSQSTDDWEVCLTALSDFNRQPISHERVRRQRRRHHELLYHIA